MEITDIAKTELDPNKRYIFRIGSPNDGIKAWQYNAEHFMNELKRIGIENVIVTPYNIDLEIIEE